MGVGDCWRTRSNLKWALEKYAGLNTKKIFSGSFGFSFGFGAKTDNNHYWVWAWFHCLCKRHNLASVTVETLSSFGLFVGSSSHVRVRGSVVPVCVRWIGKRLVNVLGVDSAVLFRFSLFCFVPRITCWLLVSLPDYYATEQHIWHVKMSLFAIY